jgi:hypothetical protein
MTQRRNKGRRKSKRKHNRAQSQASIALLKHDILDRVLWYCVPDPPDDTPATLFTHPDILLTSFKCLRVPAELSWLAGAARTCKAWLEPALQHLYHTLFLHQIRIPTPLLERVAHRVRTLVIELGFQETKKDSNIPLDLFTGLSKLVIIGPRSRFITEHFDTLIRHIRPSPVLQNIVQLTLLFPLVLVLDWNPLVDLLTACTNLRRLRCLFDDDDHPGPPEALRVARPDILEAFTLVGDACTDTVLASLYASTQLVTLNIVGTLEGIDYRLFCQAIKASSRSLRSLCIYTSFIQNLNQAGQALANALSSCTSLRFLRIGGLYGIYGSPYRLFSDDMDLRELFELLAPLPIEMISFEDELPDSTLVSLLSDNLHLLSPSLSVVMIVHLVEPDAACHTDATRRLKSKFPSLVIKTVEDTGMWPPRYHDLSPEIRAIFQFRPYRTSFSSSISSACG